MQKTAIGVMSGTSTDGIDIALIASDGRNIDDLSKKFAYYPYSKILKEKLFSLINQAKTPAQIKEIEREFTLFTAEKINDFMQKTPEKPDVIAFHGHTIYHDAAKSLTWQIGDEDLLAARTKTKIIKNFRTFDIANGGQGAPLVPIYHFYLAKNQEKPLAILNIGGISNATIITGQGESDISAFDICFGNAPMDDLVKEKFAINYDEGGKIAQKGQIATKIAEKILKNEIFHKKPPKSFDRNDFCEVLRPIHALKPEDALKTLAHIHAKAIKINLEPFAVKSIFVSGGGRKNHEIIAQMRQEMPNITIKNIEDLGQNGDAIEAEAFAFLAIRMLNQMPISFQKTTGISPEIDYALAFFR